MVNVSIIVGSISDQELGNKATKLLDDFNVTYDLKVISAHRIDGSKNAALLAIEILALQDTELAKKLNSYREKQSMG